MTTDEAPTTRSLPSWLVSSAVHLVALILVALVPADGPKPPPLLIRGSSITKFDWVGDSVEFSDFGEETDQEARRGVLGDQTLRWLVEQQQPDGGWPAAAGSHRPSDPESTSLVLLTLMQAGQTHRCGAYRSEIKAAVEHLVSSARPNGTTPPRLVFGPANRPSRTQALTTLALCKLYVQSSDKQLLQPAQQAVEQVLAAQNMKTGGWDSGVNHQADLELATWNLLALKEAHLSYLQVPPANITAAAKWFDMRVKAQASQNVEPALLLARCYLGLRRQPWCEAQIERLLAEEFSSRSLSADYFATCVVCEYGRDPTAHEWLRRMNEQVKRPRATDGQSRQDIQATALRVLIDRSRCSKWLHRQVEEDDFPL